MILALAMRVAPLTPDSVKHELIAGGVYTTVITDIQKTVDDALQNGASDDPLTVVGPFVRSEITVPYIQGKAEKLINDTDAWFNGGAPPVLSFKDLKDKLVAQHRDIVSQLESMSAELSQAQEAAKQQAAESGQPAGEMPSFTPADLQKFLSSDLSIPVGTQFGWVKSLVVFFRSALVVVGITMLLLLAGIILLSSSAASKLRWIGFTFLFTAIWNIPGIFMSMIVSGAMASALRQSGSVQTYLTPIVQAIGTPLVTSYGKIALASVVIISVIAVGFIVVSFFAKAPSPVPVSRPNKRKK